MASRNCAGGCKPVICLPCSFPFLPSLYARVCSAMCIYNPVTLSFGFRREGPLQTALHGSHPPWGPPERAVLPSYHNRLQVWRLSHKSAAGPFDDAGFGHLPTGTECMPLSRVPLTPRACLAQVYNMQHKGVHKSLTQGPPFTLRSQ